MNPLNKAKNANKIVKVNNQKNNPIFDKFSTFFNTYAPLIFVVVLVFIYAVASIIFIECGKYIKVGCTAINGVYISEVEDPYSVEDGINKIESIEGKKEETDEEKKIVEQQKKICESKIVEAQEKEHEDKTGEVQKKNCECENGELRKIKCHREKKEDTINRLNDEIADLQNKIEDESKKPLPPLTTSQETKNFTADKNKKSYELQRFNGEMKILETNEQNLNSKIVSIRKQISSRYSSRLIWVFFTSVYILLCLASFMVCGVISYKSFENDWKKTCWFLGSTAGIAFLFAYFVFSNEEHYMFIFQKVFDQSLNSHNEIPFNLINFFNVFGFGAASFLVAASCAILSSIEKVEKSTNDANDKLEEYVERMKYLRTILYVGTAMLVVGILRVSSLLQWHKAFLSTANDNAFVTLFSDFVSTLISVEGAFYTLLLASIYLPTAFIIRNKAYELPLKDSVGGALSMSAKEELLTKRGLIFSISDSLPRILAILSPLLTGQVKELFNYFTTKN